MHADNKRKDISVLGKSSTQRLDNSTLTAENEYAISFTEQLKKYCLSLHYNRADSYLFVNGVKLYQLKAKNSETNAAPLCFGNVSKAFSVDNMKKTELYGYVIN